jgi:hypothetical protein
LDARTTEPSNSNLTLAEKVAAAIAYEDPDPPTPSAWPLGSNEGRCGFLESYIWFGEVKLFEAVNHMWNSLREPKKLLSIHIGMYAGTGGSGKWALAKFLRRALRETLDYEGPAPWGQPYADIHEFHEAAMDYFAADRAHYERSIQKYADILNGEPGRHQPPSRPMVLVGPWIAPMGSTKSDLGANSNQGLPI